MYLFLIEIILIAILHNIFVFIIKFENDSLFF